MTNANVNATHVDSQREAVRKASHPYFNRKLRYTSAVDTVGRVRLACFSECSHDESVDA